MNNRIQRAMQDALFPDLPSPGAPAEKAAPAPSPPKRSSKPQAADPGDACRALAATLPPALHLGTSSWSYPGWAGLVWAGEHSESRLSKHGLPRPHMPAGNVRQFAV